MNSQYQRALFLVLACSGLQGILARTQSATVQEQTPVKVYKATDGVTSPSLVGPNFTINAPADCQHPVSGTVTLAAVVDSSGHPQNIQFVHPLGNDIDRLAVRILVADHFSAAMRNGAPVATGVEIIVTMQACDVAVTDQKDKTRFQLQLQTQPVQVVSGYDQFPDEVIYAPPDAELAANPPRGLYRVAGDVSAPVAFIRSQPITIGNEQGKAKFQGVVLISIVVDSHGLPQNLKVIRPLGFGLDQKALEIATNYRFAPAMRRHIQPVPVMIALELNFRINCDIRATGCIN